MHEFLEKCHLVNEKTTWYSLQTYNFLSRVVRIHFPKQFHNAFLVNFDKLFGRPRKIVDFTCVYVEPKSVDVKIPLFQTFSQETITGNVLQLLQGVNLENFPRTEATFSSLPALRHFRAFIQT